MQKLQRFLKAFSFSQREFAQMIGTTPNNLNMLVNGKSTPSLRLAYEIEKKTGGIVNLYDWVEPEKEVKKGVDLENQEKLKMIEQFKSDLYKK